MVNRLMEASGKQVTYMLRAEEALKTAPHKISKIYKDYADRVRSENLRQK